MLRASVGRTALHPHRLAHRNVRSFRRGRHGNRQVHVAIAAGASQIGRDPFQSRGGNRGGKRGTADDHAAEELVKSF